MQKRRVLAVAWVCLLAASSSGVAQVDCASDGIATKLQVPFVRAHAPCGFQAREPDGSTSWGSSCSATSTGLTTCNGGHQVCSANSDCAQGGCLTYHFDDAGPCNEEADCPACSQNECGGSTCWPNNTPAVCTATVDAYDTSYQFGPKGSCTLLAKSKAVTNCADVEDAQGNPQGLPEGPCHVTYLSVRCKDILRGDGNPISGVQDDGFVLDLHPRITMEGSTILDLPRVRFYFSTPLDGAMEVEDNLAGALYYMFLLEDDVRLPTCSTIEILGAEIADPDDAIFATVGLAAH